MDTQVLLDTLVRLASLGASGVCIFSIFWAGWLTMRLPAQADPERHKTLRFFMVICVLIASVSAGSGFLNVKFKAETIEDQGKQIAKQSDEIVAKQAMVRNLEDRHSRVTSYLLKSMDTNLRTQTIQRAAPELKADIQGLKLNAIEMKPVRPIKADPK